MTISVAALGDVIGSREVDGRERDRAALPILRQVRELARPKGRGDRGRER